MPYVTNELWSLNDDDHVSDQYIRKRVFKIRSKEDIDWANLEMEDEEKVWSYISV